MFTKISSSTSAQKEKIRAPQKWKIKEMKKIKGIIASSLNLL